MGESNGNRVLKLGKFKLRAVQHADGLDLTLKIPYKPVFYSDSRPFYMDLTGKQDTKYITCNLTMRKFNVTLKDECLFLENRQDKTFVIRAHGRF